MEQIGYSYALEGSGSRNIKRELKEGDFYSVDDYMETLGVGEQ